MVPPEPELIWLLSTLFGATSHGHPAPPDRHPRKSWLRPLLDWALVSAANAPLARPKVAVSKRVVSFFIFIGYSLLSREGKMRFPR